MSWRYNIITILTQNIRVGPHQGATYGHIRKMTTSSVMLWCQPNDTLKRNLWFCMFCEGRIMLFGGTKEQLLRIAIKWRLQKWRFDASQMRKSWKSMILQIAAKVVKCDLVCTEAQLMKIAIKWRLQKWCSGASQIKKWGKFNFYQTSWNAIWLTPEHHSWKKL